MTPLKLCEGHESEPCDEAGQVCRQGQGESERGERERRQREPFPADPICEPADCGPGCAEDPQYENEAADSGTEVERWTLEPVDNVREAADEREEEGRPGHSRPKEARVAELTQNALEHSSARRLDRKVDESALHDDRRRERQDHQDSDRPAPADYGSEKPHPDATDEASCDERRDVVAHRPAADRWRESLCHIGDARRQQARDTQPLQCPEHEQEGKARRQRRSESSRNEQRAGEHDRTLPAVPVRERTPDPRSAGEREHHDRDRQAGLRGTDIEGSSEFGKDRLGRIGDSEHARRSEQEPCHPSRFRRRFCSSGSSHRQAPRGEVSLSVTRIRSLIETIPTTLSASTTGR